MQTPWPSTLRKIPLQIFNKIISSPIKTKPSCVIFQSMAPFYLPNIIFRKNCIDSQIPYGLSMRNIRRGGAFPGNRRGAANCSCSGTTDAINRVVGGEDDDIYDDNSNLYKTKLTDIKYDDNSNLYADDTYINKSKTNWKYIK